MKDNAKMGSKWHSSGPVGVRCLLLFLVSNNVSSRVAYRAVQREREREPLSFTPPYIYHRHTHTRSSVQWIGACVCAHLSLYCSAAVQGGRGVWSKENMVNLCLQPPTVNPSGFSKVVV